MNDVVIKYITDGFRDFDQDFPTATRAALACGVSKSTMYLWAQKHPIFSVTLAKMKAVQEDQLLFKGLRGDYNASIAKLALHNHGYKDKADVTTNEKEINSGAAELAAALKILKDNG